MGQLQPAPDGGELALDHSDLRFLLDVEIIGDRRGGNEPEENDDDDELDEGKAFVVKSQQWKTSCAAYLFRGQYRFLPTFYKDIVLL